MKNFSRFWEDQTSISNINLREALDKTKKMIEENPELSIQKISNLFFGDHAIPCSSNYLVTIKKEISAINKENDFLSESSISLHNSFWNSSNPSFIAFCNFYILFQILEDQLSFFNIIDKFFIQSGKNSLFQFTKILELICKNSIESNEFSEYFGFRSSYSIILHSYLSILCDFELNSQELIIVTRMISFCIKKLFTIEQIFQMISCKHCSDVQFFLKFTTHVSRLLLLQSELLSNLPTDEKFKSLSLNLLKKAQTLFQNSSDSENLIIATNTIINIFSYPINGSSLIFAHNFWTMLETQYDTPFEDLRDSLTKGFSKIQKLAKKENNTHTISDYFYSQLNQIPTFTKLKKWMLPMILKETSQFTCSTELFRSLIQCSQDQSNIGFISKSIVQFVPSISQAEILFQECCKFLKEKPQLDITFEHLLEPIFSKFNELIPKALEIINDPRTGLFPEQQSFMRLTIALTTNNTEIFINETQFSQSHISPYLRLIYFTTFVRCGFPKTQKDCTCFLNNFPNFLYIQSSIQQSLYLSVFNEFAKALKKNPFHDQISQGILSQTIFLDSSANITQSNEYIRKIRQIFHHSNRIVLSTEQNTINYFAFKANTITLEKLKDFRENLSKIDYDSIPDYFIQELLNLESIKTDDEWNIKNEGFQIVAIINRKKFADKAAEIVFNSLLHTRKAGLIFQSSDALESLLRHCSLEKWKSLSEILIHIISDFDMSSMRRSAGLPSITAAIIRSRSQFTSIFNSLSSILITQTNFHDENGASNVLNILKYLIVDSNLAEQIESQIPVIFNLLLNSCNTFHSWDAMAAVNQALAAFIQKTSVNQMTFTQFLFKIKGKATLLELLSKKNSSSQAIYWCLMFLSYFSNDPFRKGDVELKSAAYLHILSVSSRIRRMAARAVIAMSSIEEISTFKLSDEVLSMNISNYNQLHGLLMILSKIPIRDSKLEQLQSMQKFITPILFPLYFQIMKRELSLLRYFQSEEYLNAFALAHIYDERMTVKSLVPLLREWDYDLQPQNNLLQRIISDLFADLDSFHNVDKSYVFHGLKFLSNYGKPNLIPESKLQLILSLIMEENDTNRCEEKGGLIGILPFIENICSRINALDGKVFLEFTLKFGDQWTPVKISMSRCMNLLKNLKEGKAIALLLLVSDIPLVRYQTSAAFGYRSEMQLINQITNELLLTEDGRKQANYINSRWKLEIQNVSKVDNWGEPLTEFVDEFFIPRLLSEVDNSQFNAIDIHQPLLSLRKSFFAKN